MLTDILVNKEHCFVVKITFCVILVMCFGQWGNRNAARKYVRGRNCHGYGSYWSRSMHFAALEVVRVYMYIKNNT